MKFNRAAWVLLAALAASALGQGVGVGVGIRGARQASFDPVLSLGPAAYWRASAGYFVDGAIKIGRNNSDVAVNNYLSLSNSVMQTGGGVWTLAATAIIDAENGSNADQTLASKAAAANYEYRVWWDRSVTKWKLTIYDATGASSATATSAATTAIGQQATICAGYNGSAAWISVDGEAAQTAAVGFTPGSGTAGWRLGSWQIATANFNGRIDSVGWFKGTTFSAGNIATYAAGVTWSTLGATLQGLATAWWDFGNASLNSTGYDPTNGMFDRANLTNWDWLLDSQSGGYTLTQSVGAGSKYPYVVRGLISPLSTAATTKKVFGWPDLTGNGKHATQPWYGLRTSFDPTGINGAPAFYFDGVVSSAINDYCGHYQCAFGLGPALTGSNVSYSACCLFRAKDIYHPSAQASPTDELLGQTLFGTGIMGYVPWSPYVTEETTTAAGTAAARFQLSTKYETILDTLALKHHWYSKRCSDAAKVNSLGDTYRGSIDTGVHAAVYSFDGSTQTSTLWIDGIKVFQNVQTSDNNGGSGALGALTTNAFLIGEGFMHKDQFVVPGGTPTGKFGSGGWAWYGWLDRVGVWTSALSDSVAQQLSKDLNPEYAATATSPPFYWPPATITHWWDPNYGTYQEKTRATAATQAVANSDPVGCWLARTGTGAADAYIAAADTKRPLFVTAYANSRPVIFSDGTDDYLTATLTRAQPFTVYLVMDIKNLAAAYRYWWCSPGQAEIISMNNTTQSQAYLGAGAAFTDSGQATFRVVTFVCNNASSKVYINGTDKSATVSGTLSINSTMNLFTYNGSAYFGQIHLADHIVDNSAHDATTVGQFTSWLKAKWAIP